MKEPLSEAIVRHLLKPADVQLGGDRPWDVQVHEPDFFRRALLEGSVGVGESYMDGGWDCADLEELVYRLVRKRVDAKAHATPIALGMRALATVANPQTRRSFRRVVQHYNLDNDLFGAFLGRYKNYSCAYYKDTEDLDVAQAQKMDLICRKLDLQPGDRVLDIGGGWGEMARHMASRYGAHVTSINISDEQIRFAREYCKGTTVDVVKCDYRDVKGRFDKVALVAMMSHIGSKNHRRLFEIVRRCLPAGGTVFIDSVIAPVSLIHGNPWIDKHIFPGAVFPSLVQIGKAVEGLFQVEDVHNLGQSYTKTLRAWNTNLQAAWPTLSKRHDERTRRMFEFFFLAVAAYFRACAFQNFHIVMSTQGATPPPRIT